MRISDWSSDVCSSDLCSIFSYDEKMETYLRATRREGIADLANKHRDFFTLDREIEEEITIDREKALDYFDQLIEIDLSKLEPYIVGPHTPDLADRKRVV